MINFSPNKKNNFPVIFPECLQDSLFAVSASYIYFTPRKDRISSNESKSALAMLKAGALNIPGYSTAIANNPDMAHVVEKYYLMQTSVI